MSSVVGAFGETTGLALQPTIQSLLASFENGAAAALSKILFAGRAPVLGSTIQSLHSGAKGRHYESLRRNAQGTMVSDLVNQYHFSLAQANQAAASVHAVHRGNQVMNLTGNVQGLSKNDKEIARSVASEIVKNLKWQGNLAF